MSTTPALVKTLAASQYWIESILVGSKSAWWIPKKGKIQWEKPLILVHGVDEVGTLTYERHSVLTSHADARNAVSRGCRQWGCYKMVSHEKK